VKKEEQLSDLSEKPPSASKSQGSFCSKKRERKIDNRRKKVV